MHFLLLCTCNLFQFVLSTSLLSGRRRSGISNGAVSSHGSHYFSNASSSDTRVLSFPISSRFSIKWLTIWKASSYYTLGKTTSDFIYFPYFYASQSKCTFTFMYLLMENCRAPVIWPWVRVFISVPVSSDLWNGDDRSRPEASGGRRSGEVGRE